MTITIDITGKFQLSKSVRFVAAKEVAGRANERFKFDDQDVVLFLEGHRRDPLLISYDTKEILEAFSKPAFLLEVVSKFAARESVSPDGLLSGVYPTLEKMISLKVLVHVSQNEVNRIKPSFAVGSKFLGRTISKCLSCLEDVEVFLIDDGINGQQVLKIRRVADRNEDIEREALALEIIDGATSPRLVDTGSFSGRPFIVMEYVDGLPILDHCAKLSRSKSRLFTSESIASLCARLIQSYRSLHDIGLLHSDIHPGNVLVGKDERIHLVDFAQSVVPGFPPPIRAGIPFYYDPDFAHAVSIGEYPPNPTELSEQYSIAALCYFLINGNTYIQFNGERDQFLKDIKIKNPNPFNIQNGIYLQNIEKVLLKALEKREKDRFVGTLDFEQAFARAFDIDRRNNAKIVGDTDFLRRKLASGIIDACSPTTKNVLRLKEDIPNGSVMFGFAGTSYAFLRLSQLENRNEYLEYALEWLAITRKVQHLPGAFYDSSRDLTPEILGERSLFHSSSGIEIVSALTHHALEDYASACAATESFMELATGVSDPVDLSFGKPGLLLACSWLYNAYVGYWDALARRVDQFGQSLEREIVNAVQSMRYRKTVRMRGDVGVAHGLAGVLYSLLSWHAAKSNTPSKQIVQLLNEFDEITDFEPRNSSSAIQGFGWHQRGEASWCNGSAGFVFLWLLAHQIFKREEYLERAVRAADHAFLAPESYFDVCCGKAGRAYAQLALHRITGDPEVFARAQMLAQNSLENSENAVRSQTSIFKGQLGVRVLTSSLEVPGYARMPLFESEGWTQKTH